MFTSIVHENLQHRPSNFLSKISYPKLSSIQNSTHIKARKYFFQLFTQTQVNKLASLVFSEMFNLDDFPKPDVVTS